MTKDKIRERYLNDIEPRIESAEKLANNPHFDKLVAIYNTNKNWGYDIFYPICTGTDFDYIVEIFHDMIHAVEDDGEMSLVSATIAEKSRLTGKDLFFTDHFVMYGFWTELDPVKVYKIATTHCSDRKTTLHEFKACHFDWNVLNFLYEQISEMKQIVEKGKSSNWKEVCSYHEVCEKMEEKVREFIIEKDQKEKI